MWSSFLKYIFQSSDRIQISKSFYEIMLNCWAHKPADRPTFDFLYDFFDDYFVATEPNYQEI